MWRGIVDCLAMRWFASRSLPLDRDRVGNEREESSPGSPVIKGIVLLLFLLAALGITYMTPLKQYLFQWRKIAEELQTFGLVAPVVFSFSSK